MQTIQRNIHYIIISVGIVLVWRGIWGIADIYLFPNHHLMSSVVSILIGVATLLAVNVRKIDVSELVGVHGAVDKT